MRKRIKRYRRQSELREIIVNLIKNNFSFFIFASILFFTGIILGVLFIKNLSAQQVVELRNYINEMMIKLNASDELYLKELIIENSLIILAMWLAGITVIGIIINFGILIYKGFCIGYTISALKIALGTWKTLGFVFSGMLLQNILLIPAMLATVVSGLRFFRGIVKNRDRESIIIGAIRHTIFSTIMIGITIVSSLVEVFISNQLLRMVIIYIV